MSLMCRQVEITTSSLTSSTISDSSTTWTYAVNPSVNSSYFDPVTRHLYKALVIGSTATVTFTAATDVVNWTSHGRANGDVFAFTTSGAAPTGLSVSTGYYIVNQTTNSFQLALTADGDPIDFTTDGTPTHTGYANKPFDDAAGWQDRGPPNKWKMFDQSNQTASTASGSIQVVVALSSRIDSIAAMALVGVSDLYVASAGTSTSHTNSALQSRTFDNASWTKTNATITANSIRGPDGALSAEKFTGTTTNGVHTLSQTISGSGTQYASIYAKAAELTKGSLAIGTVAVCHFDLSAGTATLASGSGTVGIARVNSSGWYRVWVSGTAGVSEAMTIGLRDASGNTSFAGSTTQGFYVDMAQYEATALTPHITTTTSAVTTTTHTHIEAYDLTDTSFSDDWYAATYAETIYRRDVATSTIPPWPSQSVTVTLVGPATVECGNLVFGLSKDIGRAQMDSSVGTRDYSEKETDEFGNIVITERGYAKRGNFTVVLDEDKSDAVKSLIEDSRATATLWLMAPEDVEDTGFQWKSRGIFYGIPLNWNFQFWQDQHDKFTIELEGFV